MNIEEIKGTSSKRVYAWRKKNGDKSPLRGLKAIMEVFSYLCLMIKSKDAVVACIGSSLFDLATTRCTIEERVKTPMPSNFRVSENGTAIEFDYPRSFERECGYCPNLMKEMVPLLAAAAGDESDARRIHIANIVAATVFDDGTIKLDVLPAGREKSVYFIFYILTRKEAEEIAAMEEPPDYYVLGEGPKWIGKE